MKKVLDGYSLLQCAGLDLPEAVCSVSLCGQDFGVVNADHLREFVALRRVDAAGNGLDIASFASLPVLEELSLACNGLTGSRLDLEPRDLESRLQQRKERDRPESVRGPRRPSLDSLTSLNLSHNFLLPGAVADLARLPRLRQLDLGGNRLTGLPPLDGFVHLRRLDLTGNPGLGGPEVWAAVARAPSLAELELSECGVRELPQQIDGLSELLYLGLSGNRLETEMAVAGAATLPRLQFLDLRRNPLVATVRGEPVADLSALGRLLVQHCGMHVLLADPPGTDGPFASQHLGVKRGAQPSSSSSHQPNQRPHPQYHLLAAPSLEGSAVDGEDLAAELLNSVPEADALMAGAVERGEGFVPDALLAEARLSAPLVKLMPPGRQEHLRELREALRPKPGNTRIPHSEGQHRLQRISQDKELEVLQKREELVAKGRVAAAAQTVEELREAEQAKKREQKQRRKKSTAFDRMATVLDEIEESERRIATRIRDRTAREKQEQDARALMSAMARTMDQRLAPA